MFVCVCLHVVLREAVLKMVADSDIHIHEWVKGMTQGLALQIKKEKGKKRDWFWSPRDWCVQVNLNYLCVTEKMLSLIQRAQFRVTHSVQQG